MQSQQIFHYNITFSLPLKRKKIKEKKGKLHLDFDSSFSFPNPRTKEKQRKKETPVSLSLSTTQMNFSKTDTRKVWDFLSQYSPMVIPKIKFLLVTNYLSQLPMIKYMSRFSHFVKTTWYQFQCPNQAFGQGFFNPLIIWFLVSLSQCMRRNSFTCLGFNSNPIWHSSSWVVIAFLILNGNRYRNCREQLFLSRCSHWAWPS